MNYFLLNFKHKNNIKRQKLWVQEIFMDRHSKGEFHILVKKLKLFDHEFFFSLFFCLKNCLDSACIQQFHWLIILLNNLFHFGAGFFSTAKQKKISSTRKINYCIFSRCPCAKSKLSFPRKNFWSELRPLLFKIMSIRENKFASRKPI